MIPSFFFPESLRPTLKSQGLFFEEPIKNQILSDREAMQIAIQEAYKGLGCVSPNPLVGCVVLDSKNRFLSKGYHQKVGEGHAEVNALRGLDERDLHGARIFVTLEPCAHEGRTPSCAKMLAKLPIREVIYGLEDPNPLVAGQGGEILLNSGKQIHVYDDLKLELETLAEHFLWNFREKKVWVSLKVASSLDGQMAHQNGDSFWITDSVSREVGHVLRAAHDAILVGADTVIKDNPSLNVRVSKLTDKKLKVFVMDPNGRALSQIQKLKLSEIHSPENLYFIVSKKWNEKWDSDLCRVMSLNTELLGEKSSLNLDELLSFLWSENVRSLYVEGGGVTLSSFIQQKKAQRLYLFQAPILIGAKSGKSWSNQVSIEGLSERIPLGGLQSFKLHTDLFVTGKFK